MKRRGFFERTFLGLIALIGRRAGAQPVRVEDVRELATVVLPSSLGRSRMDEIADGFVRWVRDYKDGAEISSGYGFPRTQVVGPNPSKLYPEQLKQLDLAKLDGAARRAAIEKALVEAKIDRIPQRPNGKHVAADLLAYFYGSASSEDFLYGVAIKRDDCRGLGDSGKRPARIS
jgi:hypothetical protein